MLPSRANARKYLRSSHESVPMGAVCNFANRSRNLSTAQLLCDRLSLRRQSEKWRKAMQAAADQVMDLIFGRWRSQTLSAGAELGVFDHLDTQSAKSPDALAAELGADPTLLYRLLRAQAAIGLLEEDGS